MMDDAVFTSDDFLQNIVCIAEGFAVDNKNTVLSDSAWLCLFSDFLGQLVLDDALRDLGSQT